MKPNKSCDQSQYAMMFADYIREIGTEELKNANEIASRNASLFMQKFDEERKPKIIDSEIIYYG